MSFINPYCFTGNDHEYKDGVCHDCGQLDRPTWAETWMQVARTIAERSYDPRLKVGAIIVSEDNTQVLSVGYNGNYKGGPNEAESQEPGKSGMIHAEVNALIKCDFHHPKKKHMYVTTSPCIACAKLIINADIIKVVYNSVYRDPAGIDLLESVGVTVCSLEETSVEDRVTRGLSRPLRFEASW